MASCEAVYGWKYSSPLNWLELGKKTVIRSQVANSIETYDDPRPTEKVL